MRPFGEWLAARGFSAVGPRLPGHGTSWEDLEATTWAHWEEESERNLLDLSGRCRVVVAVGLSMGGALVLHLAAKHPGTLHGVVVVNPIIRRPELRLAPLARVFMRTRKGLGNDIKKPGVDELVYDRVPLRAVGELGKLLRRADRELPSMRLPLLVFSSREDHTVKPSNSRRVFQRAGSDEKELIALPNSYHVATLDYDAETIFERTHAFTSALAEGSSAVPG
jgi:carboxylesterase